MCFLISPVNWFLRYFGYKIVDIREVEAIPLNYALPQQLQPVESDEEDLPVLNQVAVGRVGRGAGDAHGQGPELIALHIRRPQQRPRPF